ncbi:hypothetical protein CEUSTIGMA_g104.t1 [Chlamydomonas eustigma]|uniref:Uncharacterized protein n=1 Tax=Chlamydomonas eustigma TaxID=1157962 RepID=A0A250WP91_9CHLO|nr:hypothetical protein CEUSTIGMA_g104.t1 [Chlamydomonas eustigma]|eukprot:GAX72648.1 hypothetical protein CEUSTIGMA_g104.t1 [Chlamydomonas eustigma]
MKDGFADVINIEKRGMSLFPYLTEEECPTRMLSLRNNHIQECRVDDKGHPPGLNICQISNPGLKALNAYASLVSLDLSGNQLKDLNGITICPQLKVLKVSMNNLTSLIGLEGAPSLEVLDAHSNRVDDAHALTSLCDLRIVNLGGNRLRSLPHLSHLNRLEELNLRRNSLTCLCGDTHGILPASLERLLISYNRLGNLKSLETIRSLTRLKELSLEGNPFTKDGSALTYSIAVLNLLPTSLTSLDGSLVQPPVSSPEGSIRENPEDWKPDSCQDNSSGFECLLQPAIPDVRAVDTDSVSRCSASTAPPSAPIIHADGSVFLQLRSHAKIEKTSACSAKVNTAELNTSPQTEFPWAHDLATSGLGDLSETKRDVALLSAASFSNTHMLPDNVKWNESTRPSPESSQDLCGLPHQQKLSSKLEGDNNIKSRHEQRKMDDNEVQERHGWHVDPLISQCSQQKTSSKETKYVPASESPPEAYVSWPLLTSFKVEEVRLSVGEEAFEMAWRRIVESYLT